jgi:hypothetical protein
MRCSERLRLSRWLLRRRLAAHHAAIAPASAVAELGVGRRLLAFPVTTKRSDFLGVELDWFAVDSVGSVALMSSAGHGSVPDFVFDHFEAQQLIAQRLVALTGLPEGGDLIRFARALSTIGVFSYDWRHGGGPYRRMEAPSHLAHLDTLGFDASLRDAFVRFPELQFSALAEFQPQTLLPCAA